MTGPFTLPLPTYQCHKRVQALCIKAVIENPRGYELHFEDERFAPMQVDAAWIIKQLTGDKGLNHLIGGYAVWYDDGYMSWSPAAAFEAGYSLLLTVDFTPEQVTAAEAQARTWYAFQYEWPGGPSEVDAALASRDAEIDRLRAEVSSKQAEIDRLMLEFCPNEMSAEQVEEWARNQKPVGPATQAAREVGK